jgi:hypothetical protein
MSAVEFNNLVFALTESIIEAQSLVEINQIQRLGSRYFDDTGLPKKLNIILPTLENGEDRSYDVPWLSLVPHGSLVIKEASIDFDVDISSITENVLENEKSLGQMLRTKGAVELFKQELLHLIEKNNNEADLKQEVKKLVDDKKINSELKDFFLTIQFDHTRRRAIQYLRNQIDAYLDINEVKSHPKILVDPRSGGIAARKGSAAKIQLKLEATEISEGMARLLNDVVQGQGYQLSEVGQKHTQP